jgi:hypothetical protein
VVEQHFVKEWCTNGINNFKPGKYEAKRAL